MDRILKLQKRVKGWNSLKSGWFCLVVVVWAYGAMFLIAALPFWSKWVLWGIGSVFLGFSLFCFYGGDDERGDGGKRGGPSEPDWYKLISKKTAKEKVKI